jgi:hypothetical protein
VSDYERTYDEFWRDIIEPNGQINVDQLKRELHDYWTVSEVYCAITGGVVSKPLTEPKTVIALAEEQMRRDLEVGP